MSVHDERNPDNRESWHEAQRAKLREEAKKQNELAHAVKVLSELKSMCVTDPPEPLRPRALMEQAQQKRRDEATPLDEEKEGMIAMPVGATVADRLWPICPAHYAGSVTPWDLEKCMKSSGNAFVDSRRSDAIEYAFRLKGDLLGDLIKARHCLDEAIMVLKAQKNK